MSLLAVVFLADSLFSVLAFASLEVLSARRLVLQVSHSVEDWTCIHPSHGVIVNCIGRRSQTIYLEYVSRTSYLEGDPSSILISKHENT